MAMTRVGAALARRLVSPTASPWSGELHCLARKLGTASRRSSSMGEAFQIPNRSFHATPRICSPAPLQTPPTPVLPKSWRDMSLRETLAKLSLFNEVRQTLWTAISFVILGIAGTVPYFNLRLKFGIDQRLDDHYKGRDKLKAKERQNLEDAQRLERHKREDVERAINAEIQTLFSMVLEFEEKEMANRHKIMNAEELLSKFGVSHFDDLPPAIMKKLDYLDTQVIEIKEALAKSTIMTTKCLEMREEVAKIESKVSGLKEIMEAVKMSEVSAQDLGKESPAPEVSGLKEIMEAEKVSKVSAQHPGKESPAAEGP